MQALFAARMATRLAGVVVAFTVSLGTLAAEVSQLTIDAGFIGAIAIAPPVPGDAVAANGQTAPISARPVIQQRRKSDKREKAQ